MHASDQAVARCDNKGVKQVANKQSTSQHDTNLAIAAADGAAGFTLRGSGNGCSAAATTLQGNQTFTALHKAHKMRGENRAVPKCSGQDGCGALFDLKQDPLQQRRVAHDGLKKPYAGDRVACKQRLED